MTVKRYNATLRNLEYRLRSFKDSLPMLLEDIVRDKEDVIVSAIADDQLYRRGINGRGEKIMDYMPYKPKTIQIKKKKRPAYYKGHITRYRCFSRVYVCSI